jgi:hypothetical protein
MREVLSQKQILFAGPFPDSQVSTEMKSVVIAGGNLKKLLLFLLRRLIHASLSATFKHVACFICVLLPIFAHRCLHGLAPFVTGWATCGMTHAA